MIVEDEAIVSMQIKSEVEKMGHAVAGIYASGEEALEGIKDLSPDLVLMDIKLQGEMDGIETAERIFKQYDIPVIFLTAHSEESTIERAKVTEPYGYILKPFNAQALYIAIQVALYKHRIDKEKEQLNQELKKALEKVKLLSGMLPICVYCKKIRDDQGYWQQMELYIRDHSEADFSHCICQECEKKAYSELEEFKKKIGKKI